MEREEANEKARGKWRWHSLAIDRSVGRSAAQKGERRPLAIDRSSFGSTGHKKRQRRGQEAKWNNGRLRWSPKKQEASGDGTRFLRSIGLWINRPHKKEKEGHLQLINCLLDWQEARQKNRMKKARDKWQWQPLAMIVYSIDRSQKKRGSQIFSPRMMWHRP